MSIILALLIGPAVLLVISGIVALANKKKKLAKVLFILGGVYLLVSFGTCGIIMSNFTLDTK